MTDEPVTIEQANHTKKLSDSKLYTLARSVLLLDFLTPDLPVQMATESEIDDKFPRTEIDRDATRILINYRNLKGNASIHVLQDFERLERTFDIDHFMAGFASQIGVESLPGDGLFKINNSLSTALNTSASTVIGLSSDDEKISEGLKTMSRLILSSLVAVLFNDALDVLIAINDMPATQENPEPDAVMVGIWVVKKRPIVQEGDSTTIH